MNVPNYVRPSTDGRLACEMDARKFWQSRMVCNGRVPPAPELVDLRQLAREVRGGQS